MFKYLWILILGLLAASFIAYTVYAIKDCLENNVFTKWEEFLSTFIDEHEVLFKMWCAIIIATVLLLFILSLIAFGDSVSSEVSADGIH